MVHAYWKEQLAQSHYLPTPEHSLVNFSYLVGRSTYAVPYHMVTLMSWEYPYHSGQAQEDLTDQLVPASLHGLKVARPGYLSANNKPVTAVQTLAAIDSGKGFVDPISDTDAYGYARQAGYVRQGHLGRALFVGSQPECTVAGGHLVLFATIGQWAAHWNIFHVAVAPLFNRMVRGCNFETTAASDSLDELFCLSRKLTRVFRQKADGRI